MPLQPFHFVLIAAGVGFCGFVGILYYLLVNRCPSCGGWQTQRRGISRTYPDRTVQVPYQCMKCEHIAWHDETPIPDPDRRYDLLD